MAAGDAALPYPIRNVQYRVGLVVLDADGDPVAGAGGLDSEFSVDAGNFADTASEATEVNTTSGMYFLDLTAAEMNGSLVMLRVQSTTAGAKTTPIVLYPRVPVTLETGTLTAGTTANVTLTTAASTTDNAYRGCLVHITSGTGTGQGRVITAYTGSSRIAVVTPVFGTAPDATSGYSIYLTEYATSVLAWQGTRVVDATTAGTPLVHAGNTVSANVVAMAANTLTASALASDAAREVATDVTVVMPTTAVLSVTNTVSANIVAAAANTLTASALASDAAREIATDVVAVTPTATIGTAALTLTVGTTAGDVVADRLLGRNIMGGASTGRTVTEAFERIRNRVAVVTTTMSVYATDDTTVGWTAAITTAAGNPIVEIDPA